MTGKKLFWVSEMILLKGGRITHGNFWRRVMILIKDEKIIRVFKDKDILPYYLKHVDKLIKVRDRLILPGIIDMHVHFREPGMEYKETFWTGSQAALAGGVTVVGDMPNNRPRIKTPELLKKKAKLISGRSFTDYVLYAEMPDDIDTLLAFGESEIKPAAIKVFYYIEEERNLLLNSQKLPKEFLYIVHAEDPSYFREITDCNDYKAFQNSRPNESEVSAIKALYKVLKRGYKIHVAHLSTHIGLSLVLRYKREGLNISFEVTPHHLIFYGEKYHHLGSLIKCYPPIRNMLDVFALRRALRNGLIDILATDHAPHTPSEKKLDLCRAPPGIAGIQWFLPLIHTLTKKLWTEFSMALPMMTHRPALRLGLRELGKIRSGSIANLVIFNPRARGIVRGITGYSKAKATPYEGFKVRGCIETVILRGKVVYNKELFLKQPTGILLNEIN